MRPLKESQYYCMANHLNDNPVNQFHQLCLNNIYCDSLASKQNKKRKDWWVMGGEGLVYLLTFVYHIHIYFS